VTITGAVHIMISPRCSFASVISCCSRCRGLQLLFPFVHRREKPLLAYHVRVSELHNSAPTGRIFIKFHILAFFEKLLRKLKFHKNLTRVTGILNEDQYTFLIILALFHLQLEMFQANVVEEIKTHLLRSVTSPNPSKILPFMR